MARKKYEWRVGGPRPPVAADVFAREIEKLAEGDPFDLVDADLVWKSAKNPKSPIHKCWNWDEREAAEAHWRDRARDLIGKLTIVRVHVTPGPSYSGRVFYNVKVADRRGFISKEKILSDSDLKRQVILTTKRELESYVAKFLHVLQFGRVIPKLQD